MPFVGKEKIKKHFGRNKPHFIALFTQFSDSDLLSGLYPLYLCLIIKDEQKVFGYIFKVYINAVLIHQIIKN